TPVPTLPPLSARPVAFHFLVDPGARDKIDCELVLRKGQGEASEILDRARLTLRVCAPGPSYRRTFISEIDGSVQYYAVLPANPVKKPASSPALILTLHGAGVDALG